MLLRVLDDEPCAARDIVLLNAGAAIYVAGLSTSLADGTRLAAQTISSGAAKNKLTQLITVSNGFSA